MSFAGFDHGPSRYATDVSEGTPPRPLSHVGAGTVGGAVATDPAARRLDALVARVRARADDSGRRLDLRPSEFSAWVETLDTDQLLDAAAAAQAQLARLAEQGPLAAADPDAQALVAQLASAMARPDDRPLPSPATLDELAAAEASIGVALPVLLGRLYVEVANGGFGPGYGIVGVAGGWTDRGDTLVDLTRSFRRGSPFDAWAWPTGLLPICHLGDGMYACVDTTRPGAPVVVWDPSGPDEDSEDDDGGDSDLTEVAPSLEEWLRRWLDT